MTKPPNSPQDEVFARSKGEGLRDSLRLLPEAQAEVVSLAFFGELTHTEIATLLNLPGGRWKGQLQ